MRYSFHGKKRFTDDAVDGAVEARSSSEAIDLLADRGIIVQTVHLESPALGKNPVLLSDGRTPEGALPPPPPEAVLTTVADKLTTLVSQLEKLLASRPAYRTEAQANHNAGGNGHTMRLRRSKVEAEQDATLQAIFQTNLDLRKTLEMASKAAAARTQQQPAKASPRVSA